MKAARLVVLGIALAAGGAAILMVRNIRPTEQKQQSDTVDVLVAKANLDSGHVIGDQDIGWQPWPTAAVYPTIIRKTQRPDAVHQFAGSVAHAVIPTGEPIDETKVSIPAPGTRAVSIDFSPVGDFDRDFQPGEHVDVTLAVHDKVREKAAGGEAFATEKILDNVRVLAIGVAQNSSETVEQNSKKTVEQHSAKAAEKNSASAKRALLELDREQAETLAQRTAGQSGKVSLVLHQDMTRPSSLNLVRYGVSTFHNQYR